MDMADEMNVGRQMRQDALTAVGAVAGDDDLVVGEPPGDQVDEFQGQFRSGAMIRIVLGLGGFLLAFFPLRFFFPLVSPWRLRYSRAAMGKAKTWWVPRRGRRRSGRARPSRVPN